MGAARGGNQVQNPPGLAPPANLTEKQISEWEYINLLSGQRREAREAQKACIFCGSSGHAVDTCSRALRSRQLNTTFLEDEEGCNIDIDFTAGPNASGKVQLK